jgi:hypothetical protein
MRRWVDRCSGVKVGRQEEPEGEKSVDVHMLGQQGGVRSHGKRAGAAFPTIASAALLHLDCCKLAPGLECWLLSCAKVKQGVS